MKREHIDRIVDSVENITDESINEILWVGELVPNKVWFTAVIEGHPYRITVENDDGRG